MPLLLEPERRLARLVADIVAANPFLPDRVRLEREALGAAYEDEGAVRTRRPGTDTSANTLALAALAEKLFADVERRAASGGGAPDGDERDLLGLLGTFVLYHRFYERFDALARSCAKEPGKVAVPWYGEFAAECERFLHVGGTRLMPDEDAPRLVALFFQIARAFHQVYERIGGRSGAAVRLRAEIWQSIFTHDLLRYRRALQDRMAEVATLITGPSGTGKELVAAAIGRSGHVPFDVATRSFDLASKPLFLPLALSSLSPTLIESELFGHRRGAFTGALDDHSGWFERCPSHGTVFLDEVGEIDGAIQVKLLRVLQTREFERIGEHAPRRFVGRLVSATNRDPEREIASGRFREDLFYRICSDRIETPSLSSLIDGDAGELEHLLTFVTTSILGSRAGAVLDEARALAAEVADWIEAELGLDHTWPGNFRELEQCVRAYLVRGEYRPGEARGSTGERVGSLADDLRAGRVDANELLDRYCAQVYDEVGTFEGAARRLGLDRRTVRSRVESARARARERAADQSSARSASM
ncbi:MAG: sigma 54-interacting transcriptional regulator [Planctomycetota bacterium]